MNSPEVPVDSASSVMVLRPGTHPFEVLMVERPNRGFFGGIVVFPGGKVDDVDDSELARHVVTGESDDQLYRRAALRELAEETGLAAVGTGVIAFPPARDEELYLAIKQSNQRLAGESLVLVSRWVTPELAPRRFDTWFYLLEAGMTPRIQLDSDELVGFAWVTPAEALRRYDEGEWQMILPTLAHLRWLRRRASIEDAMTAAQGADGRTLIEPRRMEDGSILPIHLPGDNT
ncbi:MAG: NUDIX hydrolase [Acidimicrobiia bacterium]